MKEEIDEVLKSVASLYRINVKDMFRKTRKQRIMEARQYVMYLLQTEYKISQPRAARVFGMDHSTAYHAKKVIEERKETNQLLFQIPKPPRKIREVKKIKIVALKDGATAYVKKQSYIPKLFNLTEKEVEEALENHKPVKGLLLEWEKFLI